MASLFEALPCPLVVTDLKSILFANAHARSMLKYAIPSDIVGRAFLDILHPDAHEAALHRAELLARTRKGLKRVPVKMLASDGSSVDVWVDATPVDHGSRCVFVFSYEIRR
jgi:PAS domain S-box-containing protein